MLILCVLALADVSETGPKASTSRDQKGDKQKMIITDKEIIQQKMLERFREANEELRDLPLL